MSPVQGARNEQSASAGFAISLVVDDQDEIEAFGAAQFPPPQYPASEASSSRPPPFSSLYGADEQLGASDVDEEDEAGGSESRPSSPVAVAAPAYAPLATGSDSETAAPGSSHLDYGSSAFERTVEETKRALPADTKGESSKREDEAEPPPAYSEGPSPLQSFSFVMAAAGGASSIITQVQQGGPPINAIGGIDIHSAMPLAAI